MDILKKLPLPHELPPNTYVIDEAVHNRLVETYGEDMLLSMFGCDNLVVMTLRGTHLKTLTRPV